MRYDLPGIYLHHALLNTAARDLSRSPGAALLLQDAQSIAPLYIQRPSMLWVLLLANAQ
ncbi:hypothetical protein [Pantoea rwandensis]|nr:hypothetical protein [Pantoea rwandensis]